MAYKLLGMLTWKGAKWFLRRKYGAALAPKPLLAGALLLAIIGAGGLAAARRRELPR
jgi:hypothetical protein